MPIEYPIKFAPSAASKGGNPVSTAIESAAIPLFPKLRIEPLAKAGQECKDFSLAEIGEWPETKTVMETECLNLPWPVGRVCTDIPRIYLRKCTKVLAVRICYPVGMEQDVKDCLFSAAVASAVAAYLAGPEAAAPTLEAALKACLVAKGAAWADQVTASPSAPSTSCGDWHPV